MEGSVDLTMLGITSETEESAPTVESERAPERSTSAEATASTSETPEPNQGEEAQEETLEGPEDYSPRERMLLKRLEEMTQSNIQQREPVQEAEAPLTPQEHNFLEGLDIDDVLSDPATLNKLLLNVYNKGLAEAGRLAAENIMRSLPQTISRYVNNHVSMTEIVRDFYDRNPDLKAVRRTVAAVANEIAAAEPGLSTQQLFDRAADKTREILQIKKLAPTANNKRAPAFARQRGRSVTPELSGLQREIDELITSR